MLYSIINKKSPVPSPPSHSHTTPKDVLYAGAAWLPFIHDSYCRRQESVHTIGLRIVSDTLNYVKNEILLKQVRTNNIKGNIPIQARTMFHNNNILIYPHIQNMEHFSADTHIPNNKIKPRPMT